MNILMMTNTYTPHVGGVARSVEAYTQAFRRMGHRVVVIAPEFENMPEHEEGVVRVPAIRRFNGSDFSVRLPVPIHMSSILEELRPQVIHSHHPFMLGGVALRVAHQHEIPLVFTHHTMYEHYTHYVPANSPALRRFVIKLSTGYCNLCDRVIAPSESVADVLRRRGVETPIEVIPTGVDLERMSRGSGPGFRAALGIPAEAFVVGHLGRLAPEKNLRFLCEAVLAYLKQDPRAHFLLVGQGPLRREIEQAFERQGLGGRLHAAGSLEGPLISSAYQAMDVFAFASLSETQGLVLLEAMAAGTPVVALDAPGAREIVRDGLNGRLLKPASPEAFAAAVGEMAKTPAEEAARLKASARVTAQSLSITACAERTLRLYESLRRKTLATDIEESPWSQAINLIRAEWDVLMNVGEALTAALSPIAGSATDG